MDVQTVPTQRRDGAFNSHKIRVISFQQPDWYCRYRVQELLLLQAKSCIFNGHKYYYKNYLIMW